MLRFSDIITIEDQYEVAKARASIAFHTIVAIAVVETYLDKILDNHSVKVPEEVTA